MTEEERPAAVEETAFHRRLRRTHRGGLWAATVVAIAVLVYILLLIVENSHPVTVHYVFGTGQDLTLKVNSADFASVLSYYGQGNERLVTSDTTLDLSHSLVSGFTMSEYPRINRL